MATELHSASEASACSSGESAERTPGVCLGEGNGECESPELCTANGLSSSNDDTSGCPPPLSWRHVLENVRNKSESWEFAGKTGTLHGRTFGSGPAIYFLNGVGGNWELFALTMWLLRDEFRCVIFDYPGDQNRFSLDDLTTDLFQIADERNDEQFSLFAASAGSVLAFNAMAKSPERIDHAVIHTGTASSRLSLMERLFVGLGRMLPMKLSRLPMVRRVQTLNHRPWFPPFDHSRWEFFLENTGRISAKTLSRRIKSFQKPNLVQSLSQVSTPIQFLATEGEGVVSAENREKISQALPHATTKGLPNCGLLPFLTHPHVLSGVLRSYFTDPNSKNPQEAT
jgi:pimeloyl-ACP methyl ester carboxylesterase